GLGIPGGPGMRRRDHHQPPHILRMLDRCSDSDGAAERMTYHVGFLNFEVVEQRRDIVAKRREAQRPVSVRGVTVALHFYCNYSSSLRQLLDPFLHLTDRGQPAVD